MPHHARRSRRSQACGVALLLLLSVVGCVPSPPGPSEHPSPATGSGEGLGDRLNEDGTIPLDLALDLFAAGFGPIDGGEPDAVDPPVLSGTMAIRGLLGNWEELTPEQQATVDRILMPSGGGATGSGLGALAVPALQMEPDESIRGITTLVAEVQAELEALLSVRLGVPIVAGASSEATGASYHAFAWGTVDGRRVVTGRMDACEISVLPPGWEVIDTPQFRTMIAHEVMHCFQFDGAGGVADVHGGASWVVEGGATFASLVVAPTDYYDERWDSWLGEPGIELHKRDYDALGVYAVAEQEGADVWRHLIPLLQADSLGTGLGLLFERPAEEAMSAIARRLVREPEVSPEWQSDGPGITGTRSTVGIDVLDGASMDDEVWVLPFATAPYVVGSDAATEVIEVAVFGGTGVLGVPSGVTEEIGPEFLGRYCVTGFCECPDGGDLGGTEIPSGGPLGIGLMSAHSSDAVKVTIQVSSISQTEACGNRIPGEVLVVRFHEPEPFEVHGGHCILQNSGDLLIQAGDGRMPDGYEAPPEHRDDVSMSIYKNPASPPEAGSVDLRVGGTQHVGGSTIIVSPDRLSGSFTLDAGYTGEWVCAKLLKPDEAFGTG